MTVEEKIRRAEEIYNRRNGIKYSYPQTKGRKSKDPTLMQRMIKQIIICFLIYGVFYVVTNREYFMSQEFQTKVEQYVSQNEITKDAYSKLKNYVQKYLNLNSQENNKEENNEEESNSNEEQKEQETSETENIGGATEEVKENGKKEEESDVQKIKNTISFEKPIEGTISSTFGWRTPTTSTVPKYHTGLDIAAKTGTVIKSATDGKVILVSEEGDYGKHYKIQIDDVIIIYAHCSKLYLKEGDSVYKGQEIAEVGSTGNSTRTAFTLRNKKRG